MLAMETKEELIKVTIRRLLRIARMCARVEELPIGVDEGVEVTTAEAHTIQAIGEQERMRVVDVATYFGISKSGASQMVAKLIKKGFLDKKQSPHSNKELQLSLTPLGWRAFDAHERFHGKDMADLMERLGAFSLTQIATISVLLEALGSVMDERLSQQSKE